MYGPPDHVAAVYKAIGGTQGADGRYTFSCNSPQSISLSWGGQDWQFNISHGETAKGSGQCVGALASQKELQGVWLVGDVFMKNVYTAFSYEQSAVGFAKLT